MDSSMLGGKFVTCHLAHLATWKVGPLLPASHKTPDVSANLRALRTLDLIPENSDMRPRATRSRANFVGCVRSRRARACNRPALLRRSDRTACVLDRAPARSPPPDLHSVQELARSSG